MKLRFFDEAHIVLSVCKNFCFTFCEELLGHFVECLKLLRMMSLDNVIALAPKSLQCPLEVVVMVFANVHDGASWVPSTLKVPLVKSHSHVFLRFITVFHFRNHVCENLDAEGNYVRQREVLVLITDILYCIGVAEGKWL